MDIPAIYDRMAELAFKKVTGQLTADEERELNEIINSSPDKKELFDELIDPKKIAEDLRIMEEFDIGASWKKVQDYSPPRKKWGWPQFMWAAAAALVVICVSVYYYQEVKNKPAIVQNANKASTGTTAISDSVAVITAADGSVIAVGEGQSGIVGYINGEPVRKTEKGLICPDIPSSGLAIKTLPGRELPVQLSDGTIAWLSGNSELNFADGFAAGLRKLGLKGEAYFEVVKKEALPFAVMVRGMEVTVLGTRFTVSAYGEAGAVTTSLFYGKVRLTAGEQSMELLPYEEAVFENNSFKKIKLAKRSEEKVEGKKAGKFIFDDDIKTILEEVAKNYDYGFTYKGVMPQKTYAGKFSRNMPIDLLLMNLSEAFGFGLTLENNKIVADFTKAR